MYMENAQTVVEMRGIIKRFGGIPANDRVDFELKRGEIHSLLGENGAGKSTLMNILYGLYRADEGEVIYQGKPLKLTSSADAIRHRIGMIHQHFMLIPNLTVVENIILCMEKGLRPIPLKKAAQEISEMAERYGIQINPWEKVSTLSIGQQQRVEILKVLYRGADVLIMDEPTAVLTPQESTDLFRVLKDITAQGSTVVFISHKLWEVIEISDRITVMCSGRKVNTIRNEHVSKEELAEMMVGRRVLLQYEKAQVKPGKTVLKLEHVSCLNDKKLKGLDDLSFTVRSGEIVGIAGVDGNGQKELAEVIHGVRPATEGKVWLNDMEVTGKKPKDRLKQGLAHIPEDRHARGVILDFSISENIAMMQCGEEPFAKHGFLDRKKTDQIAQELRRSFSIKCPSVKELMKNLSGGNQQKVVVAREVFRNPSFLIAAQPSRGLDIGATEYIQKTLIGKRTEGMGILLISSDLDEVLAVSDRVLVIYEGKIMGEVIPGQVSSVDIGLMMAGVVKEKGDLS